MKTIDTRNVQTVEIERLNERISEDRQMLRLQDDSINNLLRSCRGKDVTIDELEGKLTDRERQFDTLDDVLDRTHELLHAAMSRIQEQNDEITKKDGWISSYSKNDKRLNRLLDELRADVRKRDKIIDELESKLSDQMRRNSEITEQRGNEADNRRRAAKHLHHCIGERDADIKELEAKLADSERQFNELDDVLVRTFALLHVVNGCLRKRDKTIDELESKLRR